MRFPRITRKQNSFKLKEMAKVCSQSTKSIVAHSLFTSIVLTIPSFYSLISALNCTSNGKVSTELTFRRSHSLKAFNLMLGISLQTNLVAPLSMPFTIRYQGTFPSPECEAENERFILRAWRSSLTASGLSSGHLSDTFPHNEFLGESPPCLGGRSSAFYSPITQEELRNTTAVV